LMGRRLVVMIVYDMRVVFMAFLGDRFGHSYM
jgi:hypothetical protein